MALFWMKFRTPPSDKFNTCTYSEGHEHRNKLQRNKPVTLANVIICGNGRELYKQNSAHSAKNKIIYLHNEKNTFSISSILYICKTTAMCFINVVGFINAFHSASIAFHCSHCTHQHLFYKNCQKSHLSVQPNSYEFSSNIYKSALMTLHVLTLECLDIIQMLFFIKC